MPKTNTSVKKLISDKVARSTSLSKCPADQSFNIHKKRLQQNNHSTPVYNRFQLLSNSQETPENISNDKKYVNTKSPKPTKNQNSKKSTNGKRTSTKSMVTIGDHRQNNITITRCDKQLQINSMTIDKKCGPKALIIATICNKNHSTLLDTGSQVNAISQYNVPNTILKQLKPAEHQISSYTGNNVDVLGTFETDVQIGNIKLESCFFYVTRAQCRTVIGTPALKSNHIKIDLSRNQIEQGEHTQKLSTDENNDNINVNFISLCEIKVPPLQMQLMEPCVLPKMSTKFIKINSRHPVEHPACYATIDAFDHNMEFGILVGKSVSFITPERNSCVIRVCNVNDHDIHLKPNTRIINLHSVTIHENSEIEQKEGNPTCSMVTISDQSTITRGDKLKQVLNDVVIGTKNEMNKNAVKRIIEENLEAFATDDQPLGHTDKAIYDIDTGNTHPVAQSRYRTPHFLRNEMKRIIDKNVQSGLMEPCSSPYAAPVLLVKKPNGTWRLVCDYRKLNSVTISDCYPLPVIEDLVTNLSKSKVFSAADLWTGFHQIPCSERAKTKLAITTEFGQYTWSHMPMGGKNAPSVFQRLMDRIFRSIPQSELVIYLDDMLVHSETEEANIHQLEHVLKILVANNLKIRASKTELLMPEIKFCGYIITNGEKLPNPKKVDAVRQLRKPTTRTEAQSLFGLLNYHRHFISNFSTKSAPITKSYKGQFCWTPEANDALEILKSEICDSTLKLKIPNVTDCKFVLETDASNNGYGSCLFICTSTIADHTHGPKCLRPVEYASKQFDEAQRNYSTMEKELLAGRESLRKWSHFLLGRSFTWRIDNTCLKWAHKVRSRKLKISQWLSEISEYDINIERRPSSAMKVSDCLSRSFAELHSLHVNKNDLKELQANDEILSLVRQYVANDRWPNTINNLLQPYFEKRQFLTFGTSGELLMSNTKGMRTIPPTCLKNDIIAAFHDKNGHPGIKRTISQLLNNYFWPGLSQEVITYVQTCHECQITKPNLQPRVPPQGESETPTGPWQMIAWDLIGPLPMTDHSFQYVLTGFDLFSKHVYGIPLQTKESDIVGNCMKRALFRNPQMPKIILTDNGTEFAAVDGICHRYNIKHKQSAAYNPQTNGGVERANQTLKNRLFCGLLEPDTWDERLAETLHSINCDKHEVTNLSPFAIETGHPGKNINDFIEHTDVARSNPRTFVETVRMKITNEKRNRVHKFDRPNFKPYELGDLVLARNMTSKFPRFIGPFKVIEVRGKGYSYVLQNLEGNRNYTRAAKQLKLYRKRPNPSSQTENTQPEMNESPAVTITGSDHRPEVSNTGGKHQPGVVITGSDHPQEVNKNNNGPPANERAQPWKQTFSSPFENTKWSIFLVNARTTNEVGNNESLLSTTTSDERDNVNSVLEQSSSVVSNKVDEVKNDETAVDDDSFTEGEYNENNTINENDEIAVDNDSTTEGEYNENSAIEENDQDETFHSTGDISLIDTSGDETLTIKSSESSESNSDFKINTLDRDQVLHIANIYEISTNGPIFDRIDQIDRYFREHIPCHPRNDKGTLVFPPKLFKCLIDRKCLDDLTKNILLVLMKCYGIPKPIFYTKEVLKKTIKTFIDKHIPHHPVNDNGQYIFTENEHEGNNYLSS